MSYRVELRLPEFLNGGEERLLHLRSDYSDSATETVRRMQDLYQCISAGKYNLLRAQLRSSSNLAKQTKFGNNYIRSIYLNNALHWFNASFDLLLQVVWFHYRLYNKPGESINLSDDFDTVLKQCTIERIKRQKNVVDAAVIDALDELQRAFEECKGWTNNLKHRRFIRYRELEHHKQIAVVAITPIDGESVWEAFRNGRVAYNSMDTELTLSMSQVKDTLVKCHKAIYNASATIIETIGYWPDGLKKQLYRIKKINNQ